MFTEEQLRLAEEVLQRARELRLKLGTAESCTGGLVAGLLTEIPGSSDVLERGFVVYSNRAKEELVGVPAEVIKRDGAVSESVARLLAEGAIRKSHAHLGIGVTGVAGPGGGTPTKPVGLVHIAAAREHRPTLHERHEFGDIGRSPIRVASIEVALSLLLRLL